MDSREPVASVGVVGGGTAGYLTALALKRRFPSLRVVLIESKDVPIIGVGEATTTILPRFLHGQLGITPAALFAAVQPTFKLGIRFDWGAPGSHFSYPFGDSDPVAAATYDGDLSTQSLTALLMAEDRAPLLRGPEGQLLPLWEEAKFAYHLDNAPFVGLLAEEAARAGVEHLAMTIAHVVPASGVDAGDAIGGLRGEDGREVLFDLYIDATGFRSLLMGQALASPHRSYRGSLFCDRALVAETPRSDTVPSCTTATTMDAGWCWHIPMRTEEHRGYVYSSAHLSDTEAHDEMRAQHPAMGEARVVHFVSGRRQHFWRGNVVAIGNAYGFVEPLESTALHMVIVQVGYLLRGLMTPGDRAATNDAVGAHWDHLRGFLALHYRFNQRKSTPFWRDAREHVELCAMEELVDRYRRQGPWHAGPDEPFGPSDPVFGVSGVMTMLLGQQVPTTGKATGIRSEREWRARVHEQRTAVRWALPHREALELLDRRPDLLRELGTAKGSWLGAQNRG